MSRVDGFRLAYDPGVIRFGSGAVADLDAELDAQGFDRALVVCGSTVGATPAVIDPIKAGLGDRLAGVFAETTPQKRLSTAVDGLEALETADEDVIVAVGGGSSLDVAKLVSVLAADDRTARAIGQEFEETGTISMSDSSPLPIVAVPTTLAGADLSIAAGVTATPESGLVETETSGAVSDARLMPAAVIADPAIVATTPKPILTASAMNGFNKGVETLYATTATPVTDATASHGLERLRGGLTRLGAEGPSEAVLEPVVEGMLLVQYGISRPGETTLSIIHAFGHGLTRTYAVQQGAAHGIIAPPVLAYLFEQVDGRRDRLAKALGVSNAPDRADAIVAAIRDVRDALGLPTRLRDVDGPEPAEFPAVAAAIVDDPIMMNAPAGLEPTRDEIEGVLNNAY